jgi:hypothetical protein
MQLNHGQFGFWGFRVKQMCCSAGLPKRESICDPLSVKRFSGTSPLKRYDLNDPDLKG